MRRADRPSAYEGSHSSRAPGGKIITRSKYVEIKSEKPDTPENAKWPKFTTRRFIAETIVSEGIQKAEVRRVCAEADCDPSPEEAVY